MHDDKELHVINTEQKLLFDIRKLLIEQNELLKNNNFSQKEIINLLKPKEDKKEIKKEKPTNAKKGGKK